MTSMDDAFSSQNHESPRIPGHQQITERARAIWQAEGCPEGRDFDHWLQAERELTLLLNPTDDPWTPPPRGPTSGGF